MQHICLETDDIDAMLLQLRVKGVPLIHEKPEVADNGKKYAFIHPNAAFGVLVELYELP